MPRNWRKPHIRTVGGKNVRVRGHFIKRKRKELTPDKQYEAFMESKKLEEKEKKDSLDELEEAVRRARLHKEAEELLEL